MKAYFIGLLGIFFVLSASCLFSASMWYKFDDGWATDGNAILKVFVDTGTDGVANTGVSVATTLTLDSNDCAYAATTAAYADGNYANFNLDLNCDGVLDANGADLNIVISTTTPALSKDFEFYLPGFKDMDINFDVGSLDSVVDIQTDYNLVFQPIFYDENGTVDSSFGGQFKVYLYDPSGDFVDSYDANADNNIIIPVTDFNTEPGMYKIMVGNVTADENTAGYKTFVFNVKSFNLIAYVQNTDDESKGTYGTGEDLELVVFATDINNTGITLSKIYYKADAATSFTTVSSPSKKNTISLSDFSAGQHNVKIIGTYGDYNQEMNLGFYVTAYAPEFKLKKNDNAGTKERFSGVYAPAGTVTFLFGINDLTTGQPEDINTVAACRLLLDGLKYVEAGKKNETEVSVSDNNISYNSTEKLCEVSMVAPSTEDTYLYELDLNDNYSDTYDAVNLDSSEQKLTTQQYVMFLDPIDAESAIDADTGQIDKKADKFEFFDENIAYYLNVTNLGGGSASDLNVESVNSLYIVHDGTSTALSASDYDYNYDTKLLIIDKDATALDGVAGSFELQAIFDTNSNTGELIDVFGAGKKKTFKVYVDLNMDSHDGPPYVTPDENVVLSVTVKNSSNQTVPYVTISLARVYDVENMEEVSLGSYSAVTDASGIGYLNIGSDINTGMYEVTIDVNDGTNTDEGHGFFMVKNFFAFGFPGDYQQGGAFLENAYLGMDENIDIATFVFSGTGAGFGGTEFAATDTYSIPTGTAKLFYETDDSVGMKLIYVDIVDLDTDANWTKGSVIDPGRMVRITSDVSLTPGFYEAVYDVNWNGTIDTAIAPFAIQGFGLQVCNYNAGGSVSCGESMTGGGQDLKGAPDSNVLWVLNGASSGDVSLTISLVDMKTFSEVSGADDLNFFLDNGINYDGNQMNDINFNFSSNAQDNNSYGDFNVLVYIPPGTDLGEYELRFDFLKAGVHTIYSRSITVKQFIISMISDQSGSREMGYIQDWENGGFDHNISNTSSWNLPTFCDGNNFETGDITYGYFYYPGQGSGDFNYAALVDLTDNEVFIDLDQDCNFVDDNFSITPNDKNIISALIDGNGNAPMITNVTLTGVKYMEVTGDIVVARQTTNNWAGEYDVDRNIIIPINISDISGNYLQNVSVTVNKVKKIDFLNKQMETLSSGYTVYNDNNTDPYGMVFLKMNLEETGEYQLELVIEDANGNKEKLMPWEGPIFQVKKFSSKSGFVRAARYDENVLTIDLNENPYTYWQGGNVNQAEYLGIFRESERDYDLDSDGSKDKNYYFYYPYLDGVYVVDDDLNNTEYPNEVNGLRPENLSTLWPTCLGDYNATRQQNDCNTDSIMVSSITEDTVLTTNLMSHQNKNWSFEDYNVDDFGRPLLWTTMANPLDTNIMDNTFGTNSGNPGPGVMDGSRAMRMDGNIWTTLQNPVFVYANQNDTMDINICAVSQTGGLLKTRFYYLPGGASDGNYYYNFDTNVWDANIADPTSGDYDFNMTVAGPAWQCFTTDINTGAMEMINIVIAGDDNSSHVFLVDAVQMDLNLIGRTVNIYNKTNYRAPSTAIIADSDLTASDYAMWANSDLNGTTGSVNHYYEVSFTDRLNQDVNIVDANVSSMLIKKNTCATTWGNDDMTLKGKYSGSRIGSTDFWAFNFGDLGTGIGDTNCLRYEVRTDISALVGASTYKDSTWSSFYISNNEGS
ncbi:MAG: hypothetical protein PHH82_02940 [Candidatus ainarchaeum sp.]|nr:hypothetical protein [Candidatus ainarchaeum sp.]